jgi:hypothetical protein
MPMTTVEKQIRKSQLVDLARERFGDLVKAVVDVEKNIIAIGGELALAARANR